MRSRRISNGRSAKCSRKARSGKRSPTPRCNGGRGDISQRRKDAKMTENEIGKIVADAAIAVHRALGPGLLENVYEVVLAHELEQRGLG